MAVIRVGFPAYTLKRNYEMSVIIPLEETYDWKRNRKMCEKYKTVYLLHGFGGDMNDWIMNTNIIDYAKEYKTVIVMPSGENSFYLDNPVSEQKYGSLVSEEIVNVTRNLFPLSEKREDTFIAGLSMGGFGALQNGFSHPDTFGGIIALSSALIMDFVADLKQGEGTVLGSYSYYQYIFGNPVLLKGSEADPRAAINKLLEKKKEIPRLYMACGTEDELLSVNRDFHQFLIEKKVPHIMEEGEGIHDWKFWNEYIKRGMEWILAKK